jgi:hypothetical protein
MHIIGHQPAQSQHNTYMSELCASYLCRVVVLEKKKGKDTVYQPVTLSRPTHSKSCKQCRYSEWVTHCIYIVCILYVFLYGLISLRMLLRVVVIWGGMSVIVEVIQSLTLMLFIAIHPASQWVGPRSTLSRYSFLLTFVVYITSVIVRNVLVKFYICSYYIYFNLFIFYSFFIFYS